MTSLQRIFLLGLLCCSMVVQAQQSKRFYGQQMLRMEQTINQHFRDSATGFYKETAAGVAHENPYAYLWPLCGLVQAANELEIVTGKDGRVDDVMQVIDAYYDPAPPAPGYASYIMKLKGGDRFYDDNQWIGIASMDAYFRKKNQRYLQTGTAIYKYMMTGFDTVLGGGLYWQENKKISKNTCSNGPAVLLALQLYQATRSKPYLDTALILYQWVNKHLKAPGGLYYDNIAVGTRKIDQRRFSYNTGTMLQANVYLYELTGKKAYLDEAKAIADSALSFFTGSGKFRDSYWFNAVLLRGYQHLQRHAPNKAYFTAFDACVRHALEQERNAAGLLQQKGKTANLVEHAGMLELLARLAQMESRPNKLK